VRLHNRTFLKEQMCEKVRIFECANCSTSRVVQSPVLKNVRSPFFKSKKVRFQILHFSTLSHFLILKVRLCNHTFFALFQRATKCAIAHSHIFKDRQKVRSHICTFLKTDKMCDRTYAHFQRAKMCDIRMWEGCLDQSETMLFGCHHRLPVKVQSFEKEFPSSF